MAKKKMEHTGKNKFDFITFCYFFIYRNDSGYFSNLFYVIQTFKKSHFV